MNGHPKDAGAPARILFLGILSSLISFGACLDRCNFAPRPANTSSVWKYPKENVSLHCPGHDDYTRVTTSLEYKWYKQDYICHGMDRSTVIASITDQYLKESRRVVINETRMSIEHDSGDITIRNLTAEDEHVYTCIFSVKKTHIGTVDLNIKELAAPVITGLSAILKENVLADIKCAVPKMRPPEGSLSLYHNGRRVKSVQIAEGSPLHLQHAMTVTAASNGDNVTCNVTHNVEGIVKQLSSEAQVSVNYTYYTKAVSVPAEPLETTDAILTCDVTREGIPLAIMGYKWTKNGKEFSSKQNITLSNLTSEDSGTYKCFIKNEENMETAKADAKALQLDVVPLTCLPKLDITDVKVTNESLSVSWQTIYACSDHIPDAEVVIQIQAGNETTPRLYPREGSPVIMASQKKQVVPGKFDPSKNHVLCLILQKFKDQWCFLSKRPSTGASMHSIVRKSAKVAGYILLGGSVVIAIACIISAMCSESKRRAAHKRQYSYEANSNEGGYEDLDSLHPLECKNERKDSLSSQQFRNRLASFSGSVRYCQEGTGIPAVHWDNSSGKSWSRSSSSSETPPPLPDFGELIGSRPMEPCPLADCHYNNRMSIVANTPRKTSFSYRTEVPLESLLESCQDTYAICPNNVHEQGKSPVSGDYMDMRSAACAKAQKIPKKTDD